MPVSISVSGFGFKPEVVWPKPGKIYFFLFFILELNKNPVTAPLDKCQLCHHGV